jgi:hypothetical protein
VMGCGRLSGRWTRRWPEALAVLAGAVIALIAVNAVAGGVHRSGRLIARPSPSRYRQIVQSAVRVAQLAIPGRELSRAVDAATSGLLALNQAGFGTSHDARTIVARIVVGPLRRRLAGALPVVASRIQQRVASAGAPAAFDSWPLGYRGYLRGRSEAVVTIWHLDVAATSALGLAGAEYQTTTFQMIRTQAGWRIAGVTRTSGPTPPAAAAPATQIDAFALLANRFKAYRYVP